MKTLRTVTEFSQVRLDAQLTGSHERAMARVRIAAELGLSPFCTQVRAAARRAVAG